MQIKNFWREGCSGRSSSKTPATRQGAVGPIQELDPIREINSFSQYDNKKNCTFIWLFIY